MVVLVEACKLSFPQLLSFSSPQVTSLLYDPNSLSLALIHSDSSISLYSSFSPFSLSSIPPPQTLIPAPSSSSCFLSLNPCPSSNYPNLPVVFITAGPNTCGSRVLLQFYVLTKNKTFVKAKVHCSQNGLSYDGKLGVIVDVSHGMKVSLAGSVNYFAMYSISAEKVWVFGVKMAGKVQQDGVNLRLVKCAVIDCYSPIYSISICSGLLVFGELDGVRLFLLRQLVKVRVGDRKKSCLVRSENENLDAGMEKIKIDGRSLNLNLPNGYKAHEESWDIDKNLVNSLKLKASGRPGEGNNEDGVARISSNGLLGAIVKENPDSVKPRSLKLRQDSSECGMCFVSFSSRMVETSRSTKSGHLTTKAIMIRDLSQHKLLVMDSNGDLHILHVPKSSPAEMKQLTGIMQVHKLAVLPNISSSAQAVWMSDGLYSVQMMMISDVENPMNDNEKSNNDGKLMQISDSDINTRAVKVSLLWVIKCNLDSWKRQPLCICNLLKEVPALAIKVY
ncbi:hypothetical protein Nepgr_022516 [Nepenthes gracilis]|uniref:Uncharacterized protein n=1 Tax=Nepenthes gracilis TaxID=150966 RepID=A0AAD3SZQ1_NEPGR|nr:hypothetical protein Nepgr_022516 [Nepenthes gracilis]